MTQQPSPSNFTNLFFQHSLLISTVARGSPSWHQAGVSTHNEHAHRKTTVSIHNTKQSLSSHAHFSKRTIKYFTGILSLSHKQNPNIWGREKVRTYNAKKTEHGPHWTVNSLIARLTIHVTNSRKNTEAQTRHGAQLRTAAFPNSSDKYPTAAGQSIIITEIKGSLKAVFFFFNSMKPLLHTKFTPRCLKIQCARLCY